MPSIYGPDGANRSAVPATDRRSRAAVVALVLAVLVAPIGLVVGIAARRRITASTRPVFDEQADERLSGRPVATTAIVVGALLSVVEIVLVVAVTVGIPTSWLPRNELPAADVASTIEKTVPLPAGSVSCPGPLPATAEASIVCTATQNGQARNLRATVTTVQGRDIKFDITAA